MADTTFDDKTFAEYSVLNIKQLDAIEAFIANRDATKEEELKNYLLDATIRLYEFENQQEAKRKSSRRLKKLQKAVSEHWNGTKVNEPNYQVTQKQLQQIQRNLDKYIEFKQALRGSKTGKLGDSNY